MPGLLQQPCAVITGGANPSGYRRSSAGKLWIKPTAMFARPKASIS